MAALVAGVQAPEFELPTVNGPGFSLQNALKKGPVLAVFFKISCPVCQYAFPYFERIYKLSSNVSIVGVSQNDKPETTEFMKRYGVTFPVLLDDTKSFKVSNAYGLTTVPTAFWIAEDGEIEISSIGWVKQDVEQIARKAASAGTQAPTPIFQPTEQVPDFRAG
ncbi:MAG TPA: TlpA disulfide reductase family protein [Terriglobales bacterium]|nr:TlpA disulfide reductase family protein [Terriglobales bacterium]